MTPRLTLGYREAVAVGDSSLATAGIRVRGHEFHRSTCTPRAGGAAAWQMGRDDTEGFVAGGIHASYLHLHWAENRSVTHRFVESCLARVPP